jgi:hypothetical protein
MTAALIPTDYVSTRLIGFSVTNSWWTAFRAAIPNPSAWELLWYSGGSVDVWANPDHVAWAGSSGASGALLNPTTLRSGDPDRVVFNVSGLTAALHPPGGYSNNVEEWRGYIASVIANIRSKYPNVRMIILQPNIAGPSFGTCPTQSTDSNAAGYDSGGFSVPSLVVRCTYTQPAIQSAIMALTRANVRGGYIPQASACSDFRDSDGHIITAFESTMGTAIANYYASNL